MRDLTARAAAWYVCLAVRGPRIARAPRVGRVHRVARPPSRPFGHPRTRRHRRRRWDLYLADFSFPWHPDRTKAVSPNVPECAVVARVLDGRSAPQRGRVVPAVGRRGPPPWVFSSRLVQPPAARVVHAARCLANHMQARSTTGGAVRAHIPAARHRQAPPPPARAVPGAGADLSRARTRDLGRAGRHGPYCAAKGHLRRLICCVWDPRWSMGDSRRFRVPVGPCCGRCAELDSNSIQKRANSTASRARLDCSSTESSFQFHKVN